MKNDDLHLEVKKVTIFHKYLKAIMNIKTLLLRIKSIKYYAWGKNFLQDPHYLDVKRKSQLEKEKKPKRTEIINFLLSLKTGDTNYLEIGVRNPNSNYNHIKSHTKYLSLIHISEPTRPY